MNNIKIYVKQDKEILHKANLKVIKDKKVILSCKAYIGENGMTEDKKEGDKKTPIGTFYFGIAFGYDKDINIDESIKFVKINENLYWVDDINSKNYNKLVDISNTKKDFLTAEHLIDYKKEYEYGIEIKTNPDNIQGKGSAIFLHCSNGKMTKGCLAIDKKYLKEILSIIDKSAVIKIIGK